MKPLISASTPVWKANVLVFGVLILLAQGYFYFQSRQVEKAFADNVREHAALLGEVVRLNAEGALFSESVVRDVLQTFLLNTAHFVDYLDAIKAFGPEELTALSSELGVAGIRILKPGDDFQEAPRGWLPLDIQSDQMPTNAVTPVGDRFYYRYPRFGGGEIITGIESVQFREMQEKMGLPELVRTVTGLAGIRYVRLTGDGPGEDGTAEDGVRLLDTDQGRVAETRIRLGDQVAVLGMGCELYDDWAGQNRRALMVFSVLLLVSGAVCSVLLYIFQRAHLARVREFDQAMAREAEDAALGRATAAITHEIRNPLNAISMGLQRLSLEVEELDADHQALITDLLGSVKRTDRIIGELRQFAAPLALNPEAVALGSIVNSVLNLYRPRMDQQDIVVTPPASDKIQVRVDPDYCSMLVENLVKNAVEAQPDGGFLTVEITCKRGQALLVLTNGGFVGDGETPEGLLEPYVTTKTQGSGLGLAIVRRIVKAHGGELTVSSPKAGVFEVCVGLPLNGTERR